ncbi:class I SAM-dependent methyltransferase [soil metagenome]
MLRRSIFTLFLGTALGLSIPLAAVVKGPDVAAALTGPGRPADAIAMDAGRKPVEVLSFLGLKTGAHAADIMAGGGYYTEIMARAVGLKGSVVAFEPEQFLKGDEKGKAGWDALKARELNVTLTSYPFEAFAAPANSLDFTMLHLVYHDLYWVSEKYGIPKTDPAAFLKTLYTATKPGGIVGVVDHVGAPGDTRATVDALHRIDPETVKADFKAAGFILEAQSAVLHVADDDHSKLVFDPAVRGKTDRFVFRFRKPR